MTKRLRLDDLRVIEPITASQQQVFDSWKAQNNLVLSGSAGSGKTFLALYMALEEAMRSDNPIDNVTIVRSAVPTRDVGFLPGTMEEKEAAYLAPYVAITTELFDDKEAWQKLTAQGMVEFLTTSYVRGITIQDSVVIIDEMQNLTFHELDSVITRLGNNCKLIMCGDYYQSDFQKDGDKKGILQFTNIVESMKRFDHVEFTWEDIVRSGLVRDYIMTKEMMRNG
jgi:phosphate starvation-inducible protein PhoH